jgi:hypothetical protein
MIRSILKSVLTNIIHSVINNGSKRNFTFDSTIVKFDSTIHTFDFN